MHPGDIHGLRRARPHHLCPRGQREQKKLAAVWSATNAPPRVTSACASMTPSNRFDAYVCLAPRHESFEQASNSGTSLAPWRRERRDAMLCLQHLGGASSKFQPHPKKWDHLGKSRCSVPAVRDSDARLNAISIMRTHFFDSPVRSLTSFLYRTFIISR